MFIAIFLLPESPKYFYSKQEFDKARESMNFITTFNGLPEMEEFLFDNEIENEEQIQKRQN